MNKQVPAGYLAPDSARKASVLRARPGGFGRRVGHCDVIAVVRGRSTRSAATGIESADRSRGSGAHDSTDAAGAAGIQR